MPKTNQQLVAFINYARGYLQSNQDQTKFRYALERMDKRLKPQIEEYSDALNDLQIEHAATDGHGALLADEQGNFRYTKDGLRGRNKAQRELLEKAVEFEPYFATELPSELTDREKVVCAGFVIPQEEQAEAAE